MGRPPSTAQVSNVLEHAQKPIKRFIKLSARVRLVLILLGTTAIFSAWFMPWFVVDYFLTPSVVNTAMSSKHYTFVAQLIGEDDLVKHYGNNILQIQYNGSDLVKAGYITLDQKTIYLWLALVGVTILAVWVDEWRSHLSTGLQVLKHVITWIKVTDLLSQLVLFLWYGIQATSRTLITKVATTMMIHDLGGSSHGLLHIQTGISVGQIALALGLLLSSIGILTGDAARTTPGEGSVIGLKIAIGLTMSCVTIGLFFFLFSYALFK